MPQAQDWSSNRDKWVRILEERTGESLETWNKRVRKAGLKDEESLKKWLTERGVTGYMQSLLVMERFGYPDFLTATADELIDGQYADRKQLRPIYDAIIDATSALGPLTLQARKTYVSLVAPRRTFARIQPTTRTRVDLGLRLEGLKPGGRLVPSKIHETMPLQISLTSRDEVDAEVVKWLTRAYDENC